MDKRYVVIAGATLMVLILLFEPLSRGGFSMPSGPVFNKGEEYTGTAVFNGTIRTYDPLLYIEQTPDPALMEALRRLPGVLDIKSEANAVLVQTETRDDVFPTAVWLRERNITSYSVANIAVSSAIPVQTSAGTIDATVSGGVVRVVTEPLIDSGEQVTVSMVAIISSNQVVDYSSASLLLQPVDLALEAEVLSLDGVAATYAIPWEERNSIDMSDFQDATYSKKDSMLFTVPLTPSQVMVKKQFSYIVYIDENSAMVEPSFDNITLLETNFQDTPFSLPGSKLTVRAEEAPELDHEPESLTYVYTLRLLDLPYDLDDILVLETDKEYAPGSTVEVSIEAMVLGDKVLSVRYVSLPS